MRKQTIEIELPSYLIAKIEKLAAKQGRTIDAVIDTGVSVYLQGLQKSWMQRKAKKMIHDSVSKESLS